MSAEILDRALGYPYDGRSDAFLFTPKGPVVRPHDWPDWERVIAGRRPVVAIGSNRAPRQLARKFPIDDWPDMAIPVTPVTVADHDIVYAARYSFYGSLPATLTASPGTAVSAAIVWLTEAEEVRMDASEALGHAYDRFPVRVACAPGAVFGSCCPDHVDAYVALAGPLSLATGDGAGQLAPGPVALAEVEARQRAFPALSQRQVQEAVCRALAVDAAVEDHVLSIVTDAAMREQLSSRLQNESPGLSGFTRRW